MARWFRLLHNYRAFFALPEAGGYRLLTGDVLEGVTKRATEVVPAASAVLLPPVNPSKIVCVGLNYVSHAQELNMALPEEPVLFLKPLTALSAPGAAIELPAASRQVDFEGELAVVMRRSGRNIPEDRALDWVFGYTLANDLTARDLQKRDGQWTRAKGFDGFCPLGPCVATELDPAGLEFRTLVNGELRQTGKLSDLVFSIPKLISFVSSVMTLLPGDVILTGTPPGVGQLHPGDRVRIECDAIGALENRVLAPADPAPDPGK